VFVVIAKKNMLNKHKIVISILIPFLLISLSACNINIKEEKEINKIQVMTTILPQVDFVERIGGSRVEVSEMIPPGFSPATFELNPQKIQELQSADIYFRIGHVEFEKSHMDRVASLNPDMTIIDTSKGVSLLSQTDHHHDEENNEHEEEVEGDDPHIWLSPKLVKIQAKNILDALIEYSPEDEDYFRNNYNIFINDLNILDQKLSEVFLPIKDKSILVYHPAFGYLADAYNFKQEAIEIEGKDPSPKQIKEIIDLAKEEKIKTIFVQAQFNDKSARTIAEDIGGVVVNIDPLAKDYFNNLESMAKSIVNIK